MSEFKFACPGCGQHIKCDTEQAGSQMECPTCFRKLVVPQAPTDAAGKLMITAAEVGKRPVPLASGGEDAAAAIASRKRQLPLAALGMVLVVIAAAAGGYFFRDKFFPRPARDVTSTPANPSDAGTSPVDNDAANLFPPKPDDTKWKLELGGEEIPETRAAGRVRGVAFGLQRATIKGGTLDLRQGESWPPDLGISIALVAARPEDLANKIVIITPDQTNAPKLTLRWKDEQQQPVTQSFKEGYAARFQFGTITSAGLPGKLYLCAPDEQKSYVAGTFSAQIRRPTSPKPRVPKPPAH